MTEMLNNQRSQRTPGSNLPRNDDQANSYQNDEPVNYLEQDNYNYDFDGQDSPNPTNPDAQEN